MLDGFFAPFSASVVEKLEDAGVVIAGQFDSGEFGVGGVFGSLPNKLTEAIKDVDIALCNDYTGAISRAAAVNGLYYLHPTYGTVSRYGLIQSVTSMDQIGILCKSPEVGFQVLKIIAEEDKDRGTVHLSCDEDKGTVPVLRTHLSRSVVISNQIDAVSKYSNILPQIMQILCCAELSNNISRYDGIKFGHRAKGYSNLRELYTKSRTEAFGEDVKLAAIIGAMVLSQENYQRYYDKAMRLRRLVKDSLDFKDFDVIETYCPLLSRLCGLPSLTTPEKVFIANSGREDYLEAVCQ